MLVRARVRSGSKARAGAEGQLLERLLPERIEGRVADMPAGTGRWSALLKQRGARPVCMDVSLALARAARGAAAALVGEMERLPLSDASLEGAICFRFLHQGPAICRSS